MRRTVTVIGLFVSVATMLGQEIAARPTPMISMQPTPVPEIVEIWRIDLIPSGSAFSLKKPVLDGDAYVYMAWPERQMARVRKDKVKGVVRRTRDLNQECRLPDRSRAVRPHDRQREPDAEKRDLHVPYLVGQQVHEPAADRRHQDHAPDRDSGLPSAGGSQGRRDARWQPADGGRGHGDDHFRAAAGAGQSGQRTGPQRPPGPTPTRRATGSTTVFRASRTATRRQTRSSIDPAIRPRRRRIRSRRTRTRGSRLGFAPHGAPRPLR